MCAVNDVNDCNENALGYTLFKELSTVGDRKVFKAARSTALENGKTVSVIVDANGGQHLATEPFRFADLTAPH